MKLVSIGTSLFFVVGVCQGGATTDSEPLQAANRVYRTCATLQLPDNFAVVPDPRMAAEIAVDRCEKQRLALAGRYALDNPGTRRTGAYIDTVRLQVAADLATWMVDMKTLGVQVGMQPVR